MLDISRSFFYSTTALDCVFKLETMNAFCRERSNALSNCNFMQNLRPAEGRLVSSVDNFFLRVWNTNTDTQVLQSGV